MDTDKIEDIAKEIYAIGELFISYHNDGLMQENLQNLGRLLQKEAEEILKAI